MNLAVGQGDLLTDPLQMAVAYSTLANAFTHGGEGGSPTPHLGMEIDETSGGLLQALSFPRRTARAAGRHRSEPRDGRHPRGRQPARRHLGRRVDRAGTRRSTRSTARPAPPSTPARKTSPGTCAYIGDPNRPIVIAVTVEQGGFGAETAAPVARLIASKWFGKPLKFVAGTRRRYELMSPS